MKKFFNWIWPWPERIRQLQSENMALAAELGITRADLANLKDSHEAKMVQTRRAMASLGVFIKRRHGLNLSEDRLHQFTR